MCKTIRMESAFDNLGSTLVEPVFFKSFEIVPRGTKLTWELVDRLHDLKSEIPFLYIDDSTKIKKIAPKLSSYTVNELYSKVRSLMAFYSYDSLEDVDIVMEIIESTIVGLHNVVNFDLDEYLLKLDDLYSHTLNTTIISTLLAIKSNQFSNSLIQQVALGALLHDLGYAKLCEKYMVKTISELTEEQKREHPVIGYSLVEDDPYISDVAKKIILMHHFWNDPEASYSKEQGIYLSYPMEYKGQKILQWSKSLSVSIVQVSSDFERFINENETTHITKKQAIDYIFHNREKIYGDAALLLANYISPYSIGDRVKLLNGKIGIVSGMTAYPSLPKIKVNNKEIDLSKDRKTKIVEVVP